MLDPRALMMRLYARLERPVLRLNYALVRRQWTRWRPLRWLIGRLVLAPIGSIGAVGMPLTLAEAEAIARDAAAAGLLLIGPCTCRETHHGCDHPLITEVLIYAGAEAWQATFPEQYHPASLDEVLGLMRDCRRRGIMQVTYRAGMAGGADFCICHCCADGCVPVLNRRFYSGYPFVAGGSVALVEAGCTECGLCIAVCPFEARVAGDRGLITGCLGCGLCAEQCPAGSVRMVPRRHNANPSSKGVS